MPAVSVVIPTYNRERIVIDAVESVLAQRFQDFEVIVVDDGSTDGTRAALEPYGRRIRYLYQENAGVSAARNHGIRSATGEWIAFLDSDDEWRKEYLWEQMTNVQAFPEAVAHITNAVHVFPDGEKDSHFAGINIEKVFEGGSCRLLQRPFRFIIADGTYWFLQTTMMRREALLQAGLFDEELSLAEDLDVIARLALKGPFTISNRVLVRVWRRDEDLVNLASQHNKGERGYEAFARVYTNLLRQKNLSIGERLTAAKVLSSNRRALGNLFLRRGKGARARECFARSLCVYPTLRGLIKYAASFLPRSWSLLFVIEENDAPPEELSEKSPAADAEKKHS